MKNTSCFSETEDKMQVQHLIRDFVVEFTVISELVVFKKLYILKNDFARLLNKLIIKKNIVYH